jgi:hypothetical protein
VPRGILEHKVLLDLKEHRVPRATLEHKVRLVLLVLKEHKVPKVLRVT